MYNDVYMQSLQCGHVALWKILKYKSSILFLLRLDFRTLQYAYNANISLYNGTNKFTIDSTFLYITIYNIINIIH